MSESSDSDLSRVDRAGNEDPESDREGLSRRALLARGGVVLGGVAVVGAGATVAPPATAAAKSEPAIEPGEVAAKVGGPGSWSDAPLLPLRFFSGEDANVIGAMANTIFPKDDLGPGATELGVVEYIDAQLAGAWGSGERMYRQGPFPVPETTGHGWQYAMTPAGAYRVGLDSLDAYTKATYKGQTFDGLTAAQQNDVLTALATGTSKEVLAAFTQIAAPDFFSLFYANVKEGLFADPSYGGNRGVEGWKLIRYPGDPMARGDDNFKYVLDYDYYPPGPPRPMVAGS